MAAITIDNFNVVELWNEITVKSGEDVATGRRGKFMFINSDGEAETGSGDTAPEVGGVFRGIALENQKYVGDTVTILRHGLCDYGTAFAAADPGAPVYVMDETGGVRGLLSLTIGDSAEEAIAGYIWPVWEADGTVRNLLYVNTLTAHVSPA